MRRLLSPKEASRPDQRILCFRGRPTTEMDRDELLEGIRCLVDEVEHQRQMHNQTLGVWHDCNHSKKCGS